MSGSFTFTPGGDIVITKDARTVFTTAGRLITGLPPADDYSATITPSWPDFTKDWMYNWRGYCHHPGVTDPGSGHTYTYTLSEQGQGYVSVPAQEWSATTILAAAPAGCNLFAGKVRINRTTAPTKTWNGQTVTVKPVQNQYIPFTGSVLIEAMPGMARAFSLYIDGSGNLVLHQQQSVSIGPGFANNNMLGAGGWSMGYGALPIAPGGGTIPTAQSYGAWAYGTAPALIVYTDTGMISSLTYAYSNQDPTSGNAPVVPGNTYRSNGNHFIGANAASVTDPTNYLSTYSIDIAGKFCRAS